MGIQVSDMHLLRDQLTSRRQKLETAVARSAMARNTLEKTQTANLLQLLEQVDRALERMDRGAFGICEVCHTSVEAERLFSDPLTAICLECLNPAEARALEQDLHLAARIQAGLLPRRDFSSSGWKVAYHYEPAGQVSGDYCDLVPHGDDLFFMVGDVSGKGVAAAMLMSNLHALFRVLIPTGLPLEQLVERANRLFCESTLPTQYATLIVGKADAFGNVEICNGGHPAPFHMGQHGVTPIEASTVPIGLFSDQKFFSTTLRTSPGDSLVIYTDGISEAENPDGTEYGSASLDTLLNSCRELPSRELVDRCLKEVMAFRAGSPRMDDQALMVLQFVPAAAAALDEKQAS
ncbi:MAG TPA: SpoIIE family protein phosphatase [Candidatus Angelobacter sp.]|nr:SpoIIE family protein phosphatase [Candidatus Angelobacter sp.]